jgi:hypothetical protein
MRSVIIILATTIFINACSKKQNSSPTPPTPPAPTTPLIILPTEWTKAVELMNGFPFGIEVYKRTAAFNNKAMNAYAVVFDPKNPSLEFKPVISATNKTPSSFFNEEAGTRYAVINGGFFGPNVSYSLVQYNGNISSINIKALSRPYNGSSTTYYPTRAAFGITNNGTPELHWVYHVGSGNGILYAYPSPSPNDVTQAPQPAPSSTFPANGFVWSINSAIGGSPVLIKNNTVRISDTEELISIDNNSSRARSAIGHTSNGLVMLLAVEGNNPNGGAGLNLQEMADLMKSMGCTGAMNLDGGGSTSMLINGQQTVKPSDAAGERAVVSAIIIKKR